MTYQSLGGSGFQDLIATVTSLDPVSGRIMVDDGRGTEFEISGSLRPKGTGMPKVGEQWMITKKMGLWTLSAPVFSPPIPTISGDRTVDSETILAQILDALALHGLVEDITSGLSLNLDLDNDNDPGLDYTDSGADHAEGIDDYLDPGEYEDIYYDEYPEEVEGLDDGEENQPHTQDPNFKWARMAVATFNWDFTLGPQRAEKDIKKLTRTRADVILLQEAWPSSRDDIIDDLTGWESYRPANRSAEVTILWKTETMKLLTSGSVLTCAAGAPGSKLSAKYVNWVRLKHIPSGAVGTYLSTTMEPGAANNGKFHGDSTRIGRFKDQMDALVPVLKTHLAKGAVWLGGDFSVDFRSDMKKRNRDLPYITLKNVGFHANWEQLGLKKQKSLGTYVGPGGDKGLRFNSIFTRPGTKSTVVALSQKILTGYYSDHRPVLVTYRIRKKK